MATVTVTNKSSGGTGNTTGVVAKMGARCGFRTDFFVGAVTEIALDQANTTFSAMRAATPKAISDPIFGSIVFESDFT